MEEKFGRYSPVEVCVWGNYACFSRPEMKVERVSYEVMTPSAARGIFESIFWKPEFQWQIRSIQVMKPIRHFSILRNEVTRRPNIAAAQRILRGDENYYADEDRSQRHTLCLRDVVYVLAADVVVQPGVHEHEAKYRDQFQRRVKQGQCYSMPYLGCREFTANFGPEIPEGAHLQDITVDLGRMLFDLDYVPDGSGRGQPRFFQAQLNRGILQVPKTLYRKGQ